MQVIEDTSTNECPVSLATGLSLALVEISDRADILRDARPLGDVSKLPAKLVDGLELIQIEKYKVERALNSKNAPRREDIEFVDV